MKIPPSAPAKILRFAALASMAVLSSAHSAVVIDLTAFAGDIEGSVTGPFTDSTTGQSASFATTIITNQSGISGGSNYLDFAGTQKGINNTNISGNESWTFSLSNASQFVGIDWSGLADASLAAVQSSAWIGATITPGSTAVTFNSSTGTFYFNGTLPGDRFDLEDIYGTGSIPTIAAGTGIRIFSPNGDAFALGADFTWNVVPEPSAFALAGLAAAALFSCRKRDKA